MMIEYTMVALGWGDGRALHVRLDEKKVRFAQNRLTELPSFVNLGYKLT